MKHTIELSYDMISNIVVETLKEDYRGMMNEIWDLENTDKLYQYQAQDLIHNKKMAKHILKVIQYYTNVEDFQKFLKEFEND